MSEYRLSESVCDEKREELCDWARACGLDPRDVPEDALFRFADGMVEADIYTRDADGEMKIDPENPPALLRTTRRVPLLAPFPLLRRAA